jgi:serine/threonine protein kinase
MAKAREEAKVMEKLDHKHIVTLVGTYSVRRHELFILIWPVAVCNLQNFVEDVDTLRSGKGDRDGIIERLTALELNLEELGGSGKTENGGNHDHNVRTIRQYLEQMMGCIVEAVDYCHAEKIRHLDLKPSNVLLRPGKVYLADFGIAKDVKDRDHTMTVGVQGTRGWGAPEIWSNEDEWSMQSVDIYALGLILLGIATALYDADFNGFDNARKSPETLPQYQQALKLSALATQRYADSAANTFAPKHIVDLTEWMVSGDPNQRPTIRQVDMELLDLGGIDQIYHAPCCRKSSRVVTDMVDRRFKKYATDNTRLYQDNERMNKRLRELEGRDETYQMRIENERRQYNKNMAGMQRQLEEEQLERKRLETLLAELQSGRRQRPGLPRPERSLSGGQNGGSILQSRPRTHPPTQIAAVNGRPPPPQRPLAATVSFQAKTQIRPISPTAVRRPDPVTRISTDPPIPKGTPSPGPNIPEGFTLRSRGSGSRLPIAVNPSTPIRSRSGTPGLPRDTSLTDSTQFSMASSTFSRLSGASRDSVSAAASPVLHDSVDMLSKPVPVRPDHSEETASRQPNGHTPGSSPNVERARTASIASSNIPGGMLSPVISGSAVSSPRLARAELYPNSEDAGNPKVPSLPTAKSWADVARRERR